MVIKKMQNWGENRSVIRDIFEYGMKRKSEIGAENVFDFSIGNPSVPAPQAFTDKMIELLENTPADVLHGYTSAAGDMATRKAIATYLKNKYNADADPNLIYMTCGAAASLTISLTSLVTEGDEVMTLAPFFAEYTVFVEKTGAKLVPVLARESDFQLDEVAFEKAVTKNTKAVIINSPNNPTGSVLTEESIKKLADILTRKQAEFGHPIYILSDDPYRELVYDVEVPCISNYYNNTISAYSFSKSLSIPGERIGYIAISPKADDAKDVFAAVCGSGRALGYVCAPAIFQYTVRDLLGVTSDISIYDTNRKLLLEALTDYGYTVVKPDGAFYLFIKALEDDAYAFMERAKKHELLLVPSDTFGVKGFVRLAYCVSTEQIKKSLPAFKALAEEYGVKK